MDTASPKINTKQIAKIQKPIIGSDWLIHTEDKTHLYSVSADKIPKYVKNKLEFRYKGFFYITFTDAGYKLGNEAPWQEW